jgi:hypothetical protein
MVKSGDLIQLVYTPDLTAAGIAYVGQQLPRAVIRNVQANQDTIRQLVVDRAVELAFRRYLVEQGVPYSTVPGTGFGSHASFHLILSGWRCNIRSCWIAEPGIVRQVISQPEGLLEAAALLPSEQIVAWIPGEKDLYIFAFVIGQTLPQDPGTDPPLPSEQQGKISATQPSWLDGRLYGKAIYLGGYCTHPDYSRRSRRLASGSRIFPAGRVKGKTRILYVHELRPLRELLEPKKTASF